jgi:hypothetical protein
MTKNARPLASSTPAKSTAQIPFTPAGSPPRRRRARRPHTAAAHLGHVEMLLMTLRELRLSSLRGELLPRQTDAASCLDAPPTSWA